jgi:COMPASS component SWD3
VNSYDNVMRVYDRSRSMTDLQMVHAIKGYKNKNWPIKSSFFKSNASWISSIRGNSAEELFTKDTVDGRDSIGNERDKLSEAYALLATGSADPFLYVYAIGVTEVVNVNVGHCRSCTASGRTYR